MSRSLLLNIKYFWWLRLNVWCVYVWNGPHTQSGSPFWNLMKLHVHLQTLMVRSTCPRTWSPFSSVLLHPYISLFLSNSLLMNLFFIFWLNEWKQGAFFLVNKAMKKIFQSDNFSTSFIFLNICKIGVLFCEMPQLKQIAK